MQFIPSSVWLVFIVVILVVICAGGVTILRGLGRRPRAVNDLPGFKAKVLLNKQEQLLFHKLTKMVPSTMHLFAQVSYGEFLTCPDRGKNNTMNQKRADFVICDGNFDVVAAIEYQGSGHFERTLKSSERAKKGDDTKRRSLSEAGIPLIEVPARYSLEDLTLLLAHIFGQETGLPPEPPLMSKPHHA